MALFLLILFSVGFAATHIGLSHEPLRARLVERLGSKGFQGLYSVISFATLGGAIWIFSGHRGMGPVLWETPFWLLPLVWLLMLGAFLLLVFSMRNRSPAGMTGGSMEPAGVLRVTRHPMNMGLACFGLAHMIANGNLGDLFFFGSIFVVGFFGPYHQDRRKVREKGEPYVAFQKQTSVLPFAAILTGKARLERGEFPVPLLVVALGAFLGALLAHKSLFGVAPF